MTNLVLKPQVGLGREIDRMFDQFLTFPMTRFGARSHDHADADAEFTPRVNITDTKDKVVLTFELPGIDKKDIKVLLKDGNLIVSGEREFRSELKDENLIRTEIRSGKFSRSFSLGDAVRADSIVADYKNGLLEISLEKVEEIKPREIEVRVS